MRVYSPSAEVRGHTPAQQILQTGKKNVEIRSVDAVGNYAVRIVFSDGHDSGIFSWEYLKELADNQEKNWSQYLQKLSEANASRLAKISVGNWTPDQ